MSDCDSLEVGNFYFNSLNAWPTLTTAEGRYTKREGERHGVVSFFGFQDIPGNLDLFLTDRAWSDYYDAFVENNVTGEGIVTMQTPDEGIPAGVLFGMGNFTILEPYGNAWTDVDVNRTTVDGNGTATNTSHFFDLGTDGDQVFLYCVGSDGKDRPISAFSYGGDFLRNTTADTDFGTAQSSAPSYMFEPFDENSTMTTSTPGLLVMRTPGNGKKIFWAWDWLSPCVDECVLDFYMLRNLYSDAYNWVGSHPDGSYSLPGSSASKVSPAIHALGMTVMLLWMLVVP